MRYSQVIYRERLNWLYELRVSETHSVYDTEIYAGVYGRFGQEMTRMRVGAAYRSATPPQKITKSVHAQKMMSLVLTRFSERGTGGDRRAVRLLVELLRKDPDKFDQPEKYWMVRNPDFDDPSGIDLAKNLPAGFREQGWQVECMELDSYRVAVMWDAERCCFMIVYRIDDEGSRRGWSRDFAAPKPDEKVGFWDIPAVAERVIDRVFTDPSGRQQEALLKRVFGEQQVESRKFVNDILS